VRRVLCGGAKSRYGPLPLRLRKVDPFFAEYPRDRVKSAMLDRLAATVLLREIQAQG
jgi:hypothetical protein